MPALDLIRPSVTAMRVIASVNDGFARELKLPSHIRSLGLITADSDDVTYIAADEATKQAMVKWFMAAPSMPVRRTVLLQHRRSTDYARWPEPGGKFAPVVLDAMMAQY